MRENTFFKKIYRPVFALLLVCSVILTTGCSFKPKTNVGVIRKSSIVINEVCSNNDTVISDNDGDYLNWIELYNPHDEKVYLGGYGLSTDSTDLFKHTFEFTSIPPKGFLLIFLSSKTESVGQGNTTVKTTVQTTTNDDYYETSTGALKTTAQQEVAEDIYANLVLSPTENNSIYLTASDGEIVDQINVPALEINTSIGCQPDGSTEFKLLQPTPRESNNSAKLKKKAVDLAEPVFSKESGFYDSSFNLSISAKDDYTIYYTTDCSTPTNKSKKYKGAISISDPSSSANVFSIKEGTIIADKVDATYPKTPVDKAKVIRAVAYDNEGNRSDVVSKTYFVGFGSKSGYSGYNMASVIADPDDLFNKQNGIYMNGTLYKDWAEKNPESTASFWSIPTNYSQRGKAWERDGHLDLFSAEKKLLISQNLGVRINGAYESYYLQKSLELHADKKYGNQYLQSPVFGGVSKSASILLRNGGGAVNTTKLNDIISHDLVSDRAISTQKAKPTMVFLNGEYWGFYNLRENYDATYLNAHYGVKEDDVVIYSNGKILEGNAEDVSLYKDMRNQIVKKDMSKSSNYVNACKLIDMQSFIDYCCANVYLANSNWPTNNYALWRVKTTNKNNKYSDGKWRWMMYAADTTMANSTNNLASANSFSFLFRENMFTSLMKNDEFKQQFLITFMDMTNKNFKYSAIKGKIDNYINSYSAPVKKSADRFKGGSNWEYTYFTDRIKDFFAHREEYIKKYIKTTLAIEEELKPLTVSANDSNAGNIKLNTITISGSGTWTGSYFVGYEMSATAKPKKGYIFTRWEVSDGIEIVNNINEKTLKFQIRPSKKATIKAIYTKTK